MPSRRWLSVVAVVFALFAICASAKQDAWLDTKLSPAERAHALVGRMTLDEKAAQLEDWATAIHCLGIPDYQTWNEALHSPMVPFTPWLDLSASPSPPEEAGRSRSPSNPTRYRA